MLLARCHAESSDGSGALLLIRRSLRGLKQLFFARKIDYLLPLIRPMIWMNGEVEDRYGPLEFTDDAARGMHCVFYRVVRQ